MLLQFCCSNFKSFSDPAEFRMIAEPKLTELRYSIRREKIKKRTISALTTSVIYGPNASGKSALINAMSCFRQIIIRGNIRDAENDNSRDRVSNAMNLIPFAFNDKEKPVSFDISFISNSTIYRYVLLINLGAFLSKKERSIEKEELYVNEQLVFSRSRNSVDVLDVKHIKEYLNVGYENGEEERTRKMMSDNLSYESLLLTTDFNSFCSKRIVSEIYMWMANGFIVLNDSNKGRFVPSEKLFDAPAIIEESMNEIAAEAGIIGSDFAYVKNEKEHSVKLVSVFKKNKETIVGLDSEVIESVGTLRLIAIMPAIIVALKNGSTLVIDEFDASLHPMIIMNIISIFHNDSINKKGAQLIFNTHNPIYLNHRLLRRDEIKFVERNYETKSSILYALSDFKANGKASVRKTSDYMKNYFINRYGAIVDIDFTDIISHILSEDDNERQRV